MAHDAQQFVSAPRQKIDYFFLDLMISTQHQKLGMSSQYSGDKIMKRVLSAFLAVCAVFSICVISAAAATTQIKWEDLVPKFDVLEDPLASLTADQAIDFDIMAAVRQLGNIERTPENAVAFEDAKKSETALRKQGINVEAVYEKYLAWQAEKDKQDNTLVQELDGKTVRIAGYLLPLEFSENGTSEFLLVPYVGACIHVPPPPPNQLVFVKLKKTFKADELYAPVYITGKIAAKRTNQRLALADGASSVPVGYSLDGQTVEPYKKEGTN